MRSPGITVLIIKIAILTAIAMIVFGLVRHSVELTESERLKRIALAKEFATREHQRELVESVGNGDTARFEKLLGQPSPTDLDVLFLFDTAARAGRYEMVKHLLDLGCD